MTVEIDEVAACPTPCEAIWTLPELTDDAGCPEDVSSYEEDVGWLAYEAGETESCERGSPSKGPVCVGGRVRDKRQHCALEDTEPRNRWWRRDDVTTRRYK